MLDLESIIQNPEKVIKNLNSRDENKDYTKIIYYLKNLEFERKSLIKERDEKIRRHNIVTTKIEEIVRYNWSGGRWQNKLVHDFYLNTPIRISQIISKHYYKIIGRIYNKEIKHYSRTIDSLEEPIRKAVIGLPNLISPDVKRSYNKEDKKVIEIYPGKATTNNIKNHKSIGGELGILDFKAAASSTGAGFPYLVKEGAELSNALIKYLLDKATKMNGYTVHAPPALVSEETMIAVGVLPKFKEQVYKTEDGFYLVPTAEVSLLGAFLGKTFEDSQLPLLLCAHTPCFRREAGTYGKRDQGLIRVHQFDKIELFAYERPDNSKNRLDLMVSHVSNRLKQLGIPFRTVSLPSGDLGQAAAETFDIEAWFPSQNEYIEVSSISNCRDYQARRGDIRFNPKDGKDGKKSEYVHTLNGSCLPVGRTIAAILENFYVPEKENVRIPIALYPYLDREWLIDNKKFIVYSVSPQACSSLVMVSSIFDF